MLIRRRNRQRIRPRNRPLLHLVPNLFTILGLCAGLTAIRYALDQRWELAVALVIVAGIFDGLDGRSARMLKITSKLGAELDSLADFLSFGVAPAVIVYLWSLNEVRGVGWALAMLFATCCALRLARFNSELEVPDRPRWTLYFFTGIPAPAAAGLALLPMMLDFATGLTFASAWPVNAVLFLFVACMMVSRAPTFSVKRLRVRPDLVLPTLVGAGFLVASLVTEPWLALSVIGIVYLLSLPASYIVARRMRLREEAERAAATAEQDAASASADEPGTPRLVAFDTRQPR